MVELACKHCRAAITIHLRAWHAVFPARCPNCDSQGGPVTTMRRLCDELRAIQRGEARGCHVRLVFERPTGGNDDDGS